MYKSYKEGKFTTNLLDVMRRNAKTAQKEGKRDQVTNSITVEELQENGILSF